MASPHLVEQVGRVLDGRYRVVAPIGTGASAAVFLADDVVLRRRVGVKVLHAALADDQGFLRRFQAEAHTAAGLSHPNVMRVLDWGEAESGPFLVLEYLGGGSLRSVLDASGTLSIAQAANVGLQAARALEYAHRRGLVHRDIKPGNLLFDDEGRVAIADFGLARALAEAAWTEPGGAVLGTARYASPEQVKGAALDGKSDVYALGLVLFEAICGSVPFSADTTIATLMSRVDAYVAIPEELGLLGDVIASATHPYVSERIDAAELAERLEELKPSLPIPEPIPLPGAVPIDITSSGDADPTMHPGTGDAIAVIDASESKNGKKSRPLALAPRVKKPRRFRGVSVLSAVSPRRMITAALALILLAATCVVGYGLYMFTGKQLVVPEMNNVSLIQAREAAKGAKVRLSYDGESYSETVPVGITFDQSPRAGDKIYPRQSVHIKVSKGPAPRAVPDTTGKNVDEARNILGLAGFKVAVENQYDEQAPKDKVLSQDPIKGEQPKEFEVKLVVSGGPQPRVIPDLAGKSYDEAVAVLTGLQLKVARAEAFSDNVPAGQVAGTSPGKGASADRGSTVTVQVSKGQDLVVVPNVAGMSIDAANSAMQKAGLTATLYGPATGNVLTTKPAAGSKVKRSTAVAVYIG